MTPITLGPGFAGPHGSPGRLRMALHRLRMAMINRKASRRLHTFEDHLLRDMGFEPDQIDRTLNEAMRSHVDRLHLPPS